MSLVQDDAWRYDGFIDWFHPLKFEEIILWFVPLAYIEWSSVNFDTITFQIMRIVCVFDWINYKEQRWSCSFLFDMKVPTKTPF